MRAQQAAAPAAKTIRIIHAGLVFGMVLFAIIGYLVLRPSFAADTQSFPAGLLPVLLGVSLAACALSLALRRRVRRRAADQSRDSFWATAMGPALITWATLELATIVAVLLYAWSGSPSAIGAAAIAIVLLVTLNPVRLERV